MERPNCAVLGAGSWGTALAMQLARVGCRTRLWGRDHAQLSGMIKARENARYLPGIAFPDLLEPVTSLQEAVDDAQMILLGTPSHAFAETVTMLKPLLQSGRGICWASKGFEPGSGRFLHQVAEDLLGAGHPLAVATGPSFAREVAENLPTALVVASPDEEFARFVAQCLHGQNFRAYVSTDIVGAEVGGAVKNVLAIGTGMCDGLGLGLNARAALITRGLAEIGRLVDALGGRRETLMGLSGIGDLVLTCTGDLSRNRRFGLALGKGLRPDDALAEIGQVVEGVKAAREVLRLARRYDVEMPIATTVCAILDGEVTPLAGAASLMARDLKAES